MGASLKLRALELITVVALAFFFHSVAASDADPQRDFCVADLSKDIVINGYVCKKPSTVTANDFVFQGLAKPGNTSNAIGASAVAGFVEQFPGVNTQGLSIARLDFAKGGLIPLHIHPRSSEIFYVIDGSIYSGFVTTDNKQFAKVLYKGDVMVFPRGLIHWQLNVGNGTGVGIATFNSQSPGLQLVATSSFGSNISDEVLVKSFFLDKKTVDKLKSIFGPH